jgi:CHAD domain-containing protein
VNEMRAFAHKRLSELLRKLVFELHRAPNAHDEEAVHDLRVATRRFLQVSRIFRQFLPLKALKPIRKRLRRLLELSSEVRERDIAMEMARQAGLDGSSKLVERLAQERKDAHRQLIRSLSNWNRKDVAIRWRADLELADE